MRRLTAALAVLVAAAAACSSASDTTAPTNTTLPNGSMSATIDGKAWVANATVHASDTRGILAIAGTDATFQTLAFALPANGTGTYTFDRTVGANAELTSATGVWATGANVGAGTVTITSLTATAVAGTFSFTLVHSGLANRTVTNGVFNIKF